ncbi:helicase-related protein [Halomicrobium zhouii]|nr:helicase-related protein [Halomicrobium zhouii]
MPDRDLGRTKDLEQISSRIVSEVRNRATGGHYEIGEIHVGSAPKNTFFSGCLSPGTEELEFEDDDIYSRASPSALHMLIRVAPSVNGAAFAIDPSFSVYARVHPPRYADVQTTDRGYYRKYSVDVEPTTVKTRSPEAGEEAISADLEDAEEDISQALQKALEAVRDEMAADPLRYRPESNQDVREAIVEDRFAAQSEYEEFVDGVEGKAVYPDINPRIAFDLRGIDDGDLQLRVSLENRSDEPESGQLDDVDNGMYESRLRLLPEGGSRFDHINFTRLPEDYRYNRELPGYGVNCSVEQPEGSDALVTNCMPSHEQKRYIHKEPDRDAARPLFDHLAEDPLPVLRALRDEMKEYDSGTWKDRIDELREGDGDLETAQQNREAFQEEIARLESGIKLLAEHDEALRSFKLMNRTFDRKVLREDGTRDYDSWRLFQIVFIVANIRDIVARTDESVQTDAREEVSLIWFPTGGGKTEAYLGLMIFNMLFDRLRGKAFGVTSLMRYPLRLLSLQQFQRITELMMYADEVRREQSLGGDPFEVGYLTGGTENKMRDVIEEEFGSKAVSYSDQEGNQKKVENLAQRWESDNLNNISKEEFRVLNRCPKCGGDVSLEVDAKEVQINHICTNESCTWHRLPVYVVDNEIYRKLPTLIIGTQDKLAGLGYERKFRLMLGYASEECPEHGYTDGTACTEKYFCTESEQTHTNLDPVDPVPGLQIQDELHLIKEELGTFESHYWGAMNKIIEWSGNTSSNVIAATATIEEFENQIRHLYKKEGSLFPAPGPDYRESFYAGEDPEEVQRHFIGITPWNRSHINSIISIIRAHEEAIQTLNQNAEKMVSDRDYRTLDSAGELREMLRYYDTAVNYVISKKEGDRINQSVNTQINPDLQSAGFERINQLSLTGDSSFQAVSSMLDRFESLADDPSLQDQTEDLIIATSTISHGVDLDVLNFMLFFGMPRRTAEYIQSSSRVGRKYPGIVIDCFHPIRERDRSHFHYFDKYHEYQDRLVEPVPVNRRAKFSIQRTLPGLFMALILQRYYGEIEAEYGSPYMTSNVANAHSNGLITQQQLMDDLDDIYSDWNGDNVFRDEISHRIETYLTAIDKQQKKFVSDSLPDGNRPMWSLRDVDVPVDIFTSREEGKIVDTINAGRGDGA